IVPAGMLGGDRQGTDAAQSRDDNHEHGAQHKTTNPSRKELDHLRPPGNREFSAYNAGPVAFLQPAGAGGDSNYLVVSCPAPGQVGFYPGLQQLTALVPSFALIFRASPS